MSNCYDYDNYISKRDTLIDEFLNRADNDQLEESDRIVTLEGVGLSITVEDYQLMLYHEVDDLVAFSAKLAAHDQYYEDHWARPAVKKAIKHGFLATGGLNFNRRYTLSRVESDEKLVFNLESIVYCDDDPILKLFFIGHEEGHFIDACKGYDIILSLWSEYFKELLNHSSLAPDVNGIENLLLSRINDPKNSFVREAVAHLVGLYTVFQYYDPREALLVISPGTNTDDFHHALKLIGYQGDYRYYIEGDEIVKECRKEIYGWE